MADAPRVVIIKDLLIDVYIMVRAPFCWKLCTILPAKSSKVNGGFIWKIHRKVTIYGAVLCAIYKMGKKPREKRL